MDRFVQGVIILFGSILIALVVGFAGGTILDMLYNGLFDAGAFDHTGDWASPGMTNTAINLFHFAAIAIGLTGVLAFFVIIFREESGDTTEYYRY